jgi:hypothetical protein
VVFIVVNGKMRSHMVRDSYFLRMVVIMLVHFLVVLLMVKVDIFLVKEVIIKEKLDIILHKEMVL